MTDSIITDLDEVLRLAFERREEFDALCASLEADADSPLSDGELDALVEEIATPIVAAIDCKQCANCCRSLDVCLVPTDLDGLSTALHIPIEDVVVNYVDEEAAQVHGEWAVISSKPCPLLHGNLCSIYAHRPHSCRIYPKFTPDFRYNMDDTIASSYYCPIVYNTLSRLAERIEALPPAEE
jgi:uncharacterized protein